MALAAATVIDVLAARLVPIVATGGRVHTSRSWPLADADLPAWRVFVADESAERVGVDGLHVHVLTVEATAYVRGTADIDDALHALAASGLAALFAPAVPHALQLAGIDRRLEQQGESAMGAVTLRVVATFYTYPAQPETIVSA